MSTCRDTHVNLNAKPAPSTPTCVAGHLSLSSASPRLLILPARVQRKEVVEHAKQRPAPQDIGALIDSGATHCFISPAVVSSANLSVKPAEDMRVTLADGS